jgi:hypothetical protein
VRTDWDTAPRQRDPDEDDEGACAHCGGDRLVEYHAQRDGDDR